MAKEQENTYLSAQCCKQIYEKHAGMGCTPEDDYLLTRGIFRMGIEAIKHRKTGKNFRCIMVMSVSGEDIFGELEALFPEIPGPWTRYDDILKKEKTYDE